MHEKIKNIIYCNLPVLEVGFQSHWSIDSIWNFKAKIVDQALLLKYKVIEDLGVLLVLTIFWGGLVQ